MRLRLLLVLFLATCAPAQSNFRFNANAAGEAVADIQASAVGSWGQRGGEAPMATLALDGNYNQDIMLARGLDAATYRVFLGPVSAGAHRITLTRNAANSAPASTFDIQKVNVRVLAANDAEGIALAHAPILYARADTLGRFSDLPLVSWYERFPVAGGGEMLQYSMIFTNEDGGTASDALMARWGRGSDIEYMYRVTLDAQHNAKEEIYQAPDHKDLPFTGKKVGAHPLLLIATLNNTFMDSGNTAVQYRIAPQFADLTNATRESIMDRDPWTYQVMAQELQREGKLREYGADASPNIGDPRWYLSIDLQLEPKGAGGIAVWAKKKGDAKWQSSHRGRLDFAIARNGWVRTTVELPPNTKAADVEAIAVECLDVRDPRLPATGPPSACSITPGKAFFLDNDYKPGANLLAPSTTKLQLKAGEKVTLQLAR